MIDVHYDKVIKTEYKPLYSRVDNKIHDEPIGNVAVTDHTKLLTLLQHLQGQNYKFIILDIIFDDDIPQECDDSLKKLICQMPRILIPMTENDNLRITGLAEKCGEVSYFKVNQELSKYPYIINGNKSLPLKMYEELHGYHITEHSFAFYKWYTDKGLCTNTKILTYQFKTPTTFDDENSDIYRLGQDLLFFNDSVDRGLDDLDVENQYVLIGDFISDIHHTIEGDISGTTILFNAYISLVEGKHRIKWYCILFMFLFLSTLSYFTLSSPYSSPKTKPDIKNWSNLFWESARRLFGWFYAKIGLVIVFCYITYIYQNTIYNILITSACLVVLKWLNRFWKAKEMSNNLFDFFKLWWLQ